MPAPHRHLFRACFATLAMLLASCSKNDAQRETAARAAIQERIAERQARVAEVKAEAARRLDVRMLKVKPYDRVEARNRHVLEKFGIDLDQTELCTREQARNLLEARAIGATDERFPPAQRRELVAKVAEEFPMFQVGDQVSVSTRTNRGASGIIEAMTNTYVKVGRNQILIDDVIAPDPVCFDREACEKQRRFIIHTNFDVPRRDELARQRRRLLPIVMKECGYVFSNNQWQRVDSFFEKVIKPIVDKEEKAYLAKAEEKLREEVETELLAEGILPLPPPINNPFAEEK